MIRWPTQHLHFADGYSFDAYFDQGFPDIIQLERLDDRLDLLHIREIAIPKTVQRRRLVRESILRLKRTWRGAGVGC